MRFTFTEYVLCKVNIYCYTRLYRDHILMESDKKSGMVVLPDGVVYINNFRELHTGRYTCLAVTATDLLERSIWLTVKESCLLGKVNFTSILLNFIVNVLSS